MKILVQREGLAPEGPEATSNVSESAMSEAGQHATATESSTSPHLSSVESMSHDFDSMDYVDPQSTVSQNAACTFATARSTCTSDADTITWGGCSVGAATLSGGWTEKWSAGFCPDGTRPGVLTAPNTVDRTTASQVLTTASGAKLTTNTTAHTAYDGTSIPGTGIHVSNSSGTRTVTINGIHRTLVGPRGRTLFDHTITSTGLSVTGTRGGANRVVSGSTTLYHNLAKYKAVHTFNSVTWGSATCCYPTSGTVTSTLTGSRAGNVTLAFSATCGSATFTDTDSTVSTITLNQCN